jgi:hypothetical protein
VLIKTVDECLDGNHFNLHKIYDLKQLIPQLAHIQFIRRQVGDFARVARVTATFVEPHLNLYPTCLCIRATAVRAVLD